jgi:hypothetical protein
VFVNKQITNMEHYYTTIEWECLAMAFNV